MTPASQPPSSIITRGMRAPARLAVSLCCSLALSAVAQTAPAPKPEAAARYVQGLGLVGKTGLEAARAADAQGFKECRVVGGVMANVASEEPTILCNRVDDASSPYACVGAFQIQMQLDWGGRKLPVPEMLDNLMSTKVAKVATVCS